MEDHQSFFNFLKMPAELFDELLNRVGPIIKKKVKVQVYGLISSLKTYHPTLHFTPWSLDLFIFVPFHTVLQSFRHIELIVHIPISDLSGTHFHLSQVKHLTAKCIAQ